MHSKLGLEVADQMGAILNSNQFNDLFYHKKTAFNKCTCDDNCKCKQDGKCVNCPCKDSQYVKDTYKCKCSPNCTKCDCSEKQGECKCLQTKEALQNLCYTFSKISANLDEAGYVKSSLAVLRVFENLLVEAKEELKSNEEDNSYVSGMNNEKNILEFILDKLESAINAVLFKYNDDTSFKYHNKKNLDKLRHLGMTIDSYRDVLEKENNTSLDNINETISDLTEVVFNTLKSIYELAPSDPNHFNKLQDFNDLIRLFSILEGAKFEIKKNPDLTYNDLSDLVFHDLQKQYGIDRKQVNKDVEEISTEQYLKSFDPNNYVYDEIDFDEYDDSDYEAFKEYQKNAKYSRVENKKFAKPFDFVLEDNNHDSEVIDDKIDEIKELIDAGKYDEAKDLGELLFKMLDKKEKDKKDEEYNDMSEFSDIMLPESSTKEDIDDIDLDLNLDLEDLLKADDVVDSQLIENYLSNMDETFEDED